MVAYQIQTEVGVWMMLGNFASLAGHNETHSNKLDSAANVGNLIFVLS